MGTYKVNHQEKITRALDWWVSWDVLGKQFYCFIIFVHPVPVETCSGGLSLSLLISESLADSVLLLFTPNFKMSSGHYLKTCITEIFTHD